MSMTVGNVIDILMLFLLAATIFYAWRLSLYLKIFRDGRAEMEGLVAKLDDAIDRAEKSVLGMRGAAESAGEKLNETVREAKFLGDELNFMTEAGNNLANRLEKLAEQNRQLVEQLKSSGGIGTMGSYRNLVLEEDEEHDIHPAPTKKRPVPRQPEPQAEPPAPEPVNDTPELGSQAERELYEALVRKRSGGKG